MSNTKTATTQVNKDKALELAADQWFQILLETFQITKTLPNKTERKNHA